MRSPALFALDVLVVVVTVVVCAQPLVALFGVGVVHGLAETRRAWLAADGVTSFDGRIQVVSNLQFAGLMVAAAALAGVAFGYV
ncbi:MAG: hypothetical protein ACOYNI_06435 [Acidimicrobiia bacterium]